MPAASKNRGVCKGEKKSCGGEQGWLDPDYSSLAGFENIEKSCDGLDNDCDGNTDNPPFDLDNDLANCGQCGKNCRTDNAEPYCLMGVCSIKSCLPGWCDLDQSAANGCEHANVSTQNGKEICDQKDNDCDGLVDEDFDLQQDPENCSECDKKCSFDNAAAACLKGQCQLLWCQDYYFDHNQNAADGCEIGPCLDEGELCDGQDNDCDGVTDEELQSKQCPLFKGVCRGITRQCGGQNGWDSCSDQDYGPDFQAQETSCDGLDNDCDGLVDEMILEGDPDQDCSCFVESAVNGLQQAYAIIGIPFSLAVTPDLGLQIFTDSQTGSIISRPIYPEAGRKPLQRDRKISLSLTQVSLGRQRSYVGV